MANKFKTTLAAILAVADEITVIEVGGFTLDLVYLLKSNPSDEVVTLEYHFLNEEIKERADELGRELTPEEIEQIKSEGNSVVRLPAQEVVYDDEEGTTVKDVEGREVVLGFQALQRLTIYHVGMRSSKDTPLEIVEGYPECQNKVPRPD